MEDILLARRTHGEEKQAAGSEAGMEDGSLKSIFIFQHRGLNNPQTTRNAPGGVT